MTPETIKSQPSLTVTSQEYQHTERKINGLAQVETHNLTGTSGGSRCNEKLAKETKLSKESKQSSEDCLPSNAYNQSFLSSIERNQIRISRFILTIIYLFNLYPTSLTTHFKKYIHLQYGFQLNGHVVYDIGTDDAYYVLNWIVTLTFLRSFCMQWVFSPFASKVFDIHSSKAKIRFAEQSWTFVYCTCSFVFGVCLYVNSPYYLNLDKIYADWPHDCLSAAVKRYYLIQMSFWFQQVFVLNIEQRRKDHYQMFSHHIITCLLIIGSYHYYFTSIGHLILMIMDSVDILLAAAKMLKYSGFSTACDYMFILFLVSWIILRHGVYNVLFYHTWTKLGISMKDTECLVNPNAKRCWTQNIINIFLGLLGGLQILTLIWMYLILKVAYKVISGTGAEDVRSDDEDTDVEDEEENSTEAQDFKVEIVKDCDEVNNYAPTQNSSTSSSSEDDEKLLYSDDREN